MIRDEEEKVLKVINSLRPWTAWKISHLWGPMQAVEIGQVIDELEVTDIAGLLVVARKAGFGDNSMAAAGVLLDWAYEQVADRERQQRAREAKNFERQTANKTRYLYSPIFTYYETHEGQRRWKFVHALRSRGLLELAVNNYHDRDETVPVAIGMVNILPEDQDGHRPEIDDEVLNHINNCDIAISGERLGYNMDAVSWDWLVKAFPKAIDMSAYCHGLNAPVLPEGFMTPKVQMKRLDLDGHDLQTDGSGLYHPEAPEVKKFVSKYGRIPFQFRFINSQGVFAKGMLFPTERSVDQDGEPTITFDWNQVKGAHKQLALKRRADNEVASIDGYLAVIGMWRRPGKLKACFELLENLEVRPETKEIITSQVDKAFERLVDGGLEGLLAMVAEQDETIKLIVQLVAQMKYLGADIEATQVPRIREAIADKLGRVVWHITQGAGIAFDRYVCRLDSTIPPGKCVVSGIKPQVQVATFRFPTVLAQGLTTLETIEAPEHLLCEGEEVPYQVVMNPQDLVVRMQGDDDGDIVGISTDPQMVELFNYLIDDNIYEIEPEGVKMDIPSDSTEGLKFIQRDQRGPVGRFTIYRTRLLAVGDYQGATAMSLLIQEAIDKAKRIMEWSDFKLAVNPANWDQDPDGHWHFNHKLSGQIIQGGVVDIQAVRQWVNHRIKQFGGQAATGKAVLGWRYPNKKIPLENFEPSSRFGWNGGNLVHICHDYAWSRWQDLADNFEISNNETTPLEDILPTLMSIKGLHTQLVAGTWKEYQRGLRAKSGLTRYGRTMAKIQNQDLKQDERLTRLATIKYELESKLQNLSVDELCTIWWWEAREGNPNNCFTACAWPGSPIMRALGMSYEQPCGFTEVEKAGSTRLQRAISHCLDDQEPWMALTKLIYTDRKHQQEVKDPDGLGIPLRECDECRTRLQQGVVNTIRDNKRKQSVRYMAEVNSELNETTAYRE